MSLGLVARASVALSDSLNSIYRVLKGVDAESIAVRLPPAGSFEVRHSVTAAPVLRVTDAGIAAPVDGSYVVDNTITSAKIADATIVDADVATSAGIAVAKLAHVGADNVLRSNGTANVGGPIVTNDMVINTINGDRLANNSVQAAKLGSTITAPATSLLLPAVTLGAPAGQITFAAIPQTARHLELRVSLRGTDVAQVSQVVVQFNADGSTSYESYLTYMSGTTVTVIEYLPPQTYSRLSVMPAAGATVFPNARGPVVVSIPDYTSTTSNKTLLAASYAAVSGVTGGQNMFIVGGLWYGVGAITQITILPTAGQFATGSTASLYGWA